MNSGPHRNTPRWRLPSSSLSRRKTIVAMAALLSAVKVKAADCLLTPDSGEGPFYFDPKLVRSNIRDNQPGAPLDLAMEVVRASDCATLENARVDIWHANAIGLYSGYVNQNGVGDVAISTATGKQYLRGTQFTDADGRVQFQTVYPSWYYGRTPHVHFKIFLNDNEVVASQIYFPEDINEEVFAHWDPYREHAAKRNVTNRNDRFLRRRVEGAFSEVEKVDNSYQGTVVIAIDA